jgi:hypothetical protein
MRNAAHNIVGMDNEDWDDRSEEETKIEGRKRYDFVVMDGPKKGIRKHTRAEIDRSIELGKALLTRYCDKIGATWTVDRNVHELEITFADGRKVQTYFGVPALDYERAVTVATTFLATTERNPDSSEWGAPDGRSTTSISRAHCPASTSTPQNGRSFALD